VAIGPCKVAVYLEHEREQEVLQQAGEQTSNRATLALGSRFHFFEVFRLCHREIPAKPAIPYNVGEHNNKSLFSVRVMAGHSDSYTWYEVRTIE